MRWRSHWLGTLLNGGRNTIHIYIRSAILSDPNIYTYWLLMKDKLM